MESTTRTTRNAWQSPACSPPGANATAKLIGYWSKVRHFFHQIFVRRWTVIVGINARIRVAMLSTVMVCQSTRWRYAIIFVNWRQKSFTIATSLVERLQKEVGLIMPIHMCTYPDNFLKIDPVFPYIIGLQSLQRAAKKKRKQHRHISYSRSARQGQAGRVKLPPPSNQLPFHE